MRLLLIEDEEDIADAVARGLRQQGYAVDVVYDGLHGWDQATTEDYDLLLLDLSLPNLDGLEICRRLRATQPALKILMLTARGIVTDRVIGLDSGADDYLVKPFHFQELLARIRALLRRDLRTRQPVLRCGDLQMDVAVRRVYIGPRQIEDLTSKEFGILEYLLTRPDEVVKHQELLDHVWDGTANPFTNAVRVHMTALRRKLGDDAAEPRYIEAVVGYGYRLRCTGPHTP